MQMRDQNPIKGKITIIAAAVVPAQSKQDKVNK